MLGSAIAPTLFGIALLCCELNSTVTATLSGQIVMEGFIHIRLPAWARICHYPGDNRDHLV
jgi:manganese transport protein